ncbi:MAG: hypothetical protein ACI9SQ_000824 [Rubritalea sp.]|jgi:hypothetical protein
MSNEPEKFTEKELEALAREQGKPVREGFIKDVLERVREPQKDRKQELEDTVKEKETDNPEMET